MNATPKETTELAALLPCPFCGGAVELERAHQSRHEHFGVRQWWGVKCRNTINLGGTCAIEQVPSASPEAAIERWNRRAPTAELAQSDCATFEAWAKSEGLMVEEFGILSINSHCDTARKAWQAARTAPSIPAQPGSAASWDACRAVAAKVKPTDAEREQWLREREAPADSAQPTRRAFDPSPLDQFAERAK